MGDSHARNAGSDVRPKIAKQRSWSFSVAAFPTCAWERDLRVVYTRSTESAAHAKDWYERVIPEKLVPVTDATEELAGEV